MLPDFPKIKKDLDKIARAHLRACIHSIDPVLAKMPSSIQHEGDTRSYETVDRQEVPLNYERTESVLNIPFAELIELSINDIFNKLGECAEEFARSMSKQFYRIMDQATREAGTAVDAKGKPFSFQLYLEALETVEIQFDETEDKPDIPMIIMGPQQYAKCKREIESWATDAEKIDHIEKVIHRKYQEWYDRENNRKLVE